MVEKIKAFIKKYYEQLSYLFFGGLATLLNLVISAVFIQFVSVEFATGIGNIIDNVICILFAYWTNRTFVFRSKNTGKEALTEFGQFAACRVGTMVLDQFDIWLGVTIIGSAIIPAESMKLWAMGVKLVSQVIVIIANYFFSKLFIFKKKQ